MSERVTAEALRSAAKARRTVADGDYAGKLLEVAADTIAALEREVTPVKFRWEKGDGQSTNLFAGPYCLGWVVGDGAWWCPTHCGMEDTEAEARAALEAEILKQLRGGE